MEVLQRTANRGSIATGAAYEIENSLKLEADNAEYLYYTPSGQTDYERMAFSIWVKRTELGDGNLAEFGNGTANTSNLRIGFDSSDRLFCYGNSIIWRQTNQVFRDTSAWYHLFFLFDTTTPGGISNNRIRIWVNGEMIPHTEFGVINNPGSGAAMGFNNPLQQSIGAQREGGPTNYFKGYIAQAYGSGGTPPVVTDFGEVDENTGIWKPIDISELTPPDTAGFNLDFSDASNLGNDISTRNNNFTLQNITSADQATDTPTNNFATLNPLIPYAVLSGAPVISEGATKHNGSGGWTGMKGTIGVNKGKWYWELRTNSGNGAELIHGIQTVTSASGESTATSAHNLLETAAWYVSGGHWIKDETSGRDDITAGLITQTYGNTVIHAVALNMDDGEITYYANGSVVSGLNQVDLDGLAGETVAPFASVYNQQLLWNLGGYTTMSISSAASDENGYGTFEYAPPSGYYALCTKNLAEFG